jgi:hypothetical protein
MEILSKLVCMEAMAMQAVAMEAMATEAVAMEALATEAMAMEALATIPGYMVGGVFLWIPDTTGPEAVATDIMVLAMRVRMEQLSSTEVLGQVVSRTRKHLAILLLSL